MSAFTFVWWVSLVITFDNANFFLSNDAIDYPIRTKLNLAGRMNTVTGRHKHIVCTWFRSEIDIGARWIRFGGGMRVVDDDRVFVVVIHFTVEPQKIARIEFVKRGRHSSVQHRDEPLWPI